MNNENNTAERATLKAPEVVTCWKCLGKKVLAHYSHVAGGVCFACGGSGKCSIREWTRGVALRRDWQEVTFEHGGGSSWGLITDGAKGDRWVGVLHKPRVHRLAWIRRCLESLKTELTGSTIFTVSVLLASLDDADRAGARAVAFLGETPAAAKLAEALAGGVAVVALARELAAKAGFAPPAPYRMPTKTYAVVSLHPESCGTVAGSEHDGLDWDDAVDLLEHMTDEHGDDPGYEIVKWDAGKLAFVSRDGTRVYERV